jgi:guanylate kinase
MKTNKLVILTGPSCIGKSPLEKALAKVNPDLRKSLHKLLIYNDRQPRPGERDGIDYHFSTTDHVQSLQNNPDFIFMNVRGDLQALDLNDLQKILENCHAFFEGNPYVAKALLDHPGLTSFPKLSVFLSPLSKAEIMELKDPARNIDLPKLLSEIMRRKQLRRKTKQKVEISLNDLEDVERRVKSAYEELSMAWQFDYVIPNHDGEDSDNWEMFYWPVGDARRTLNAFIELLKGNVPEIAEKWDKGFLGQVSHPTI